MYVKYAFEGSEVIALSAAVQWLMGKAFKNLSHTCPRNGITLWYLGTTQTVFILSGLLGGRRKSHWICMLAVSLTFGHNRAKRETLGIVRSWVIIITYQTKDVLLCCKRKDSKINLKIA